MAQERPTQLTESTASGTASYSLPLAFDELPDASIKYMHFVEEWASKQDRMLQDILKRQKSLQESFDATALSMKDYFIYDSEQATPRSVRRSRRTSRKDFFRMDSTVSTIHSASPQSSDNVHRRASAKDFLKRMSGKVMGRTKSGRAPSVRRSENHPEADAGASPSATTPRPGGPGGPPAPFRFSMKSSHSSLFQAPEPKAKVAKSGSRWTFLQHNIQRSKSRISQRVSKSFGSGGFKGSGSAMLLARGISVPLAYARIYRNYLYAFVQSSFFDGFCGALILANAIMVGLETESESIEKTDGEVSPEEKQDFYVYAQLGLNIWYCVELSLRVISEGHTFLVSKDWRWNWFDTFLVATSILDLCATTLDVGGLEMGRLFKAIRLFRIVRTLRIVRMLQYIREFRKMIYSLMASLQTLFWSLLLLFFVIYTYGIWFTQGAKEVIRAGNLPDEQVEADLMEFYGTLTRSCYSLYLAIFNGKSWGILVEPLFDTDKLMVVFFLSYISVSFLGVLNVVTSVFVESAMQSTQHYKDLMVQEKARAKETFVRHVKEIFHQIDTNGSGSISAGELKRYIEDEQLQMTTYFEALELNPRDTHALFKLMDPGNSGEIDIEEFCDGCVRLQGAARSFDVNCILYEQRRQKAALTKFIEEVRERFKHVVEHEEWLEKAVLKIPNALSQVARVHAPSPQRLGGHIDAIRRAHSRGQAGEVVSSPSREALPPPELDSDRSVSEVKPGVPFPARAPGRPRPLHSCTLPSKPEGGSLRPTGSGAGGAQS